MIIYELFKSVEIGANEYDIGIQDILQIKIPSQYDPFTDEDFQYVGVLIPIFWRPFCEMADLVDFSDDYGSTSTGLEGKQINVAFI